MGETHAACPPPAAASNPLPGAYDDLGRLLAVTTPAGEPDYEVHYRPFERQRKKDLSEAYEKVYHYDAWGRLARRRLTLPYSVSSVTVLMDYAYDVAGRVVEIVHPESTTVRYEYEGAYLKRVCDLGAASDCQGAEATAFVSDVVYDALGRRQTTVTPAGTRTFSYDAGHRRLTQDHFDAAGDAFWYQRDYTAYDGVGNVVSLTTSSQPGDLDAVESYEYDTRNRLTAWSHGGQAHAYAYDDLGNRVLHAGQAQAFDDPARPHALKQRVDDGAAYTYDADGNAISILGGPEGPRHFQYDSAGRLVCRGATAGGCDIPVVYDVDGRRVSQERETLHIDVAEGVRAQVVPWEAQIEIRAFGERVAYKRSNAEVRTAGGVGLGLPPLLGPGIGGLVLLGLMAWAARGGTPVPRMPRPGIPGLRRPAVGVLVSPRGVGRS